MFGVFYYDLLTEWEGRTRKYLARGPCAMTESKYFAIRPVLAQSRSIFYILPPRLSFFFRVITFAIGMFTYVVHFDRKVGIYIATKLFQFASLKEPYAILAGPDGFFRSCSRYRVRPSYRDFLNSFAMKARAGPYGVI